MPKHPSLGDPTARGSQKPSVKRTFQPGKIDPIIEKRRPVLTIGTIILLAFMAAFGLYATGNLPQLDAAFDSIQFYGRSHNDTVVNAIIAYGPAILGAFVVVCSSWILFLYINSLRRRLSDPKGWHKAAKNPPERRHTVRSPNDPPSLIHPLGKVPMRRATDVPQTATAATTDAALIPAASTPTTPPPSEQIHPATDAVILPLSVLKGKEPRILPEAALPSPLAATTKSETAALQAARANAANAEAFLTTPQAKPGLPSMIMPLGKTRKLKPDTPPTNTATP
jgi:hypothetical protein